MGDKLGKHEDEELAELNLHVIIVLVPIWEKIFAV